MGVKLLVTVGEFADALVGVDEHEALDRVALGGHPHVGLATDRAGDRQLELVHLDGEAAVLRNGVGHADGRQVDADVRLDAQRRADLGVDLENDRVDDEAEVGDLAGDSRGPSGTARRGA